MGSWKPFIQIIAEDNRARGARSLFSLFISFSSSHVLALLEWLHHLFGPLTRPHRLHSSLGASAPVSASSPPTSLCSVVTFKLRLTQTGLAFLPSISRLHILIYFSFNLYYSQYHEMYISIVLLFIIIFPPLVNQLPKGRKLSFIHYRSQSPTMVPDLS